MYSKTKLKLPPGAMDAFRNWVPGTADKSDILDLKSLPAVIVPRYADGTKRSFLRSLVPFTVFGAVGSTAAAVRTGFQSYPQLINQFFSELESCDTETLPRVMFAETMQMILEGSSRQADIRKRLGEAYALFSGELNGNYGNQDRLVNDPAYRLRCHQLLVAAGYYEKFTEIYTNPTQVGQHFLGLAYSSNIQKDSIIRDAVNVVEDWSIRGSLTPEYNELLADICMLERDLYGPWRFDGRGGTRLFFFHLKLESLGRAEECVDLINLPVFRTYINVAHSVREVHAGRWNELTIVPLEEDHRAWRRPPPAPLEDEGDLASTSSPGRPPIDTNGAGSPAGVVGGMIEGEEDDDDAYEDLPLTPVDLEVPELRGGSCRIAFNIPLTERTQALHERADSAKFDLPVVHKPVGFLERWFNRGV